MRLSIDIDRRFSLADVGRMLGELTGARAPRLLSAVELAERFGVPAGEVDAWESEGLLPDPLMIDGRRFWREVDVVLWQERGRLLCEGGGADPEISNSEG